jgi:hypothetical protein
MIMTALEGRKVHRRPVPMTVLRLGDYKSPMEQRPITFPYKLPNTASVYTSHIPYLFVDPAKHDHALDIYLLDLLEADHPAPIINMVEIRKV